MDQLGKAVTVQGQSSECKGDGQSTVGIKEDRDDIVPKLGIVRDVYRRHWCVSG